MTIHRLNYEKDVQVDAKKGDSIIFIPSDYPFDNKYLKYIITDDQDILNFPGRTDEYRGIKKYLIKNKVGHYTLQVSSDRIGSAGITGMTVTLTVGDVFGPE